MKVKRKRINNSKQITNTILCSIVANNKLNKREEVLNTRKHIVVPVVMMVQGVHSGSGGALLYTNEELGKQTEQWNGRPVVIGHPKDEQGNFTTANSPDSSDAYAVGCLYNTSIEETKLLSEVWIDVKNAKEKYPEVITKLDADDTIEVSTGLTSTVLNEKGNFNGKEYVGVATNIIPDHLAILLNEKGACSCESGCGINVTNSAGGLKTPENIEERLVSNRLSGNLTFNEIRDGVTNAVRNALPNSKDTWLWIRDISNKEAVYAIEDTNNVEKYYKTSYTINKDKQIVLGNDLQEVERVITYEPIGGIMDREKVVNCLIANTSSWQEKDREVLMNMEEATLEKISAMDAKCTDCEAEIPAETTPVVEPAVKEVKNEEAVVANLGIDKDVLALLQDPNSKEVITNGVKLHVKLKTDMITNILANSLNTFTKEELTAMQFNSLEKLNKIATKQEEAPIANFFGGNVPNITNNNSEVEQGMGIFRGETK